MTNRRSSCGVYTTHDRYYDWFRDLEKEILDLKRRNRDLENKVISLKGRVESLEEKVYQLTWK